MLAADLAAAKKEASDTRPLGARLDSAKARAAKAAEKLASSEAALAGAVARRDEARSAYEGLQAEVVALEAEVARLPSQGGPALASGASTALAALADGVRGLLEAVEQCDIGVGAEPVLAQMFALHQMLRTSEPPDVGMDGGAGVERPGGHDTALPSAPGGAVTAATLGSSVRQGMGPAAAVETQDCEGRAASLPSPAPEAAPVTTHLGSGGASLQGYAPY